MLKGTGSDGALNLVSGMWSALDALTDPVALVDDRGAIRHANTAWYRLSGDTESRPGSDCLALLAAEECLLIFSDTDRNAIRGGIDAVLSGACARVDLDLRTNGPAAGTEAQRWFALVLTPCFAAHEGVALVHLRDVTAQKETEIALRASEESLVLAQQIAKMGNWDWDIRTGGLRWSDGIFRIFGREPREFDVSYQAFLDAIHPDDREGVVDAVDKAVNQRVPYAIDHRIVLPTGETGVVHEQGKVFYDDAGAPFRMLGIVQDITERKQSADIIRLQAELNERLEAAVAERTEELRRTNGRLEQELNARENAERARAALQDEVIRVQRALLEELSTPLIPIRKDVMVLPLIGAIDARRAEQMLATVLNVVAAQQARVVIIDITGAKEIDAHVANTLIRMAHALGLIGVQAVLTGMRPHMARALIELDVSLSSLVVRGTLESGVAYATARR